MGWENEDYLGPVGLDSKFNLDRRASIVYTLTVRMLPKLMASSRQNSKEQKDGECPYGSEVQGRSGETHEVCKMALEDGAVGSHDSGCVGEDKCSFE